MKNLFVLLLAASALVVTSCKPKVQVVDPSLEMTNEYEFNVMNTLYQQYSTDSATMMNIVKGLGFTNIGGTVIGGKIAYRNAGEASGKNAPTIEVKFSLDNTKLVTGVTYYSYSANNGTAAKAQYLKTIPESVKLAGYNYKFLEATLDNTFASSYTDMVSKLGVVTTKFNAKWQQTFETAVIVYRPMVVNAEWKADIERTQLLFMIDSPYTDN